MSKLPLISIVSINWNSCDDILELLTSIEKSDYPKKKIEVIVVDNASTDRSVEKIKKRFPKVGIIALSENEGVSARNYGFKASRGEIIITIDSDAIVPKDAFKKTVGFLQKDKSIGILGSRVVNKKTKKEELSPMSMNFYTGIINMLNPKKKTSELTFLPFIFCAMRREILKKVGLLNKVFFFYGEDVDFFLRAKKKEIKILYTPDVFVYHGKAKTTPDISHSVKYRHYYKALFRNLFRYANLLQIISASIIQLILAPVYRLLTPDKSVFKARWWGFWWNVKNAQKETKLLLGAFLVGLILRLLALNQRDFWFDEAFTYHLARLPIPDLFAAVLSDNNPPFYYLVIHFVLKIGRTPSFLRLPSLVFSLASIPLLYTTAAKLTNKKVGAISASLLAVSPLAIYMATEARPHALGILLVPAIVTSFLVLLKKEKTKTTFIFILISILGLYTQYYLALLFIPFTWIILKKKASFVKKWFIIMLVAVTPLLPWLILSVFFKHSGCSCPNTLLSLPASLASPVIGGIGEVTMRTFPNLPLPTLLLFSATALGSLYLFLKGLSKQRSLSALYLIPLSLLSIFGLLSPVFSPKAFAIFSPIYFAIVGLGVYSLKPKIKLTILLFLSLLLVSSFQISSPFFSGTKLKPVFDVVKQEKSAPVAHTSLLTFYSLNYHSQGEQKNILITQNPLSSETLKYIGGQTKDVEENTNNLWLVDTQKWVDKSDYERSLSKVYKDFSIRTIYEVDDIKINYLERK